MTNYFEPFHILIGCVFCEVLFQVICPFFVGTLSFFITFKKFFEYSVYKTFSLQITYGLWISYSHIQ